MFTPQQIGYGTTQANAVAPKEIGLLQRIDGVRNGLDEITQRLRVFSNRIGGEPTADSAPTPRGSGMPSCLSDIEQSIRDALMTIGRLEETF